MSPLPLGTCPTPQGSDQGHCHSERHLWWPLGWGEWATQQSCSFSCTRQGCTSSENSFFFPPFFCFPGFKLLYLLDVVRNGIRTQNMRLTFTLTLFIAKAASQILKPGTTAGPLVSINPTSVIRHACK